MASLSPSERRELAARSAVVHLPTPLWGGNPIGIGAACQWVLTPEDESKGTYRVRLRERRKQGAGRLVQAHKMGHRGNLTSPGTFARLESLEQYHPMSGARSREMAAYSDLLLRADDREATKLSAALLRIQTCDRADLPDVVRTILRDELLPTYHDASTWLIRVKPALSMRTALARALLMAAEDPAVLTPAGSAAGGLAFQGARGLLGDTTFGLDAYLTPLLAAQSPWVTGVAAPRNGGVVALLFGELVRAQTGVAAEILQLFHPNGDGLHTSPAAVTPVHVNESMKWWTTQLDHLFTEVTDPCNYRLADETFDVRAQFETLLGLEQAFRNLQSILAGDRDAHAGRVACLDTLDTLEGLRLGLDFRAMSRLPVAEQALADIRQSMPDAVRSVLLPKAEAAVDALRLLQDGFFPSARRVPGGIRLPDKNGVDIEVPLADATASWIRRLRNAGHSFRSRSGGAGTRDEALLLSHDGNVPSPFNGLAYLYLLRLLAHPRHLRDARSDPKLRGR